MNVSTYSQEQNQTHTYGTENLNNSHDNYLHNTFIYLISSDKHRLNVTRFHFLQLLNAKHRKILSFVAFLCIRVSVLAKTLGQFGTLTSHQIGLRQYLTILDCVNQS